MKNQQHTGPDGAHQMVSVDISTAKGNEAIRIGFTDQRLTAYGGLDVWSQFLRLFRDFRGFIHCAFRPYAVTCLCREPCRELCRTLTSVIHNDNVKISQHPRPLRASLDNVQGDWTCLDAGWSPR